MAEAHIHVNTSSFEGFPNTFVQAWARGAVVMSLAVDPDGDMQRLGIGFRTGSIEELKREIVELESSPARRQSIAKLAFDFARANHSLDAGQRLAQLLLDTAASTKRRP
jgi:glycosyltransferase involved in cell wall biosynthesis